MKAARAVKAEKAETVWTYESCCGRRVLVKVVDSPRFVLRPDAGEDEALQR